MTWLERHTSETGEPRQYEEGAADDVRGPRSGGIARSSILSRVRVAAPVDRAAIVQLSQQEAEAILCIAGGRGIKRGFLSRDDALPPEITKLKPAQLKAALKRRKLDEKGKKAELQTRLRDAIIDEEGG